MQLDHYYHTSVKQLGFSHDPGQEHVVAILTDIQKKLMLPQNKSLGIGKIFDLFGNKNQLPPRRGCYIWGGVGRGKTWIMDLFFNSIVVDHKLRLHFHRFMQKVHDDLNALKGEPDPLQKVAKKWARDYRLICLDEFHVTDITDAMLLYGLLDSLFTNGVTLVATSNNHPDDLYRNGLQRARFVPAIELIKQHTHVTHLGGNEDHRLQGDTLVKMYYTPINADTEQLVKANFQHFSSEDVIYNHKIEVNKRKIDVVAVTEHTVWFDFHAICGTSRSARDYIELSKRYHTVFITNVTQFNDYEDDKARRFINLIDEFYDNRIRLVMSAQHTPEQLYVGRRLQFEFTRTASRLQEMQTQLYLDRSRAARAA